MFFKRIPTISIPRSGGSFKSILKFLFRIQQRNVINSPPSRAKTISISKAKIVPPTSATGPRTVLAVKNIAMIVNMTVRVVATSPVGGQNECVIRLDRNVDLVLFPAFNICDPILLLLVFFCSSCSASCRSTSV